MNQVRKQHSDYWLSLTVFGLIVFGLVMIYSVSKYYSLDITNGRTDKYFLIRQLIFLAIGLVTWVVFQAIDYRYWQKNAKTMFFATIGLLLLPIILKPFGVSSAGRWINLGFSNFQPAEVAKLTMIFYLAGWLGSLRENTKAVERSFWLYILIVGFVAVLMLLQKDLGTLSIFILIAASIIVVAGAPLYQILTGGGLAFFLGWLAVKIEPYRLARLTAFLNPNSADTGATYHIRNALIAIGSGGIWGLGFGQSKQKYLYLPEAHTDSIFAIICEELGLVRAAIIPLVFTFLALRGFKIAREAPDIFARLTAVGITVWIFGQMIINIAAMLSLVPLTGVPLPFISYGGTSLVVLLAAVGVLTNISKNRVISKNATR